MQALFARDQAEDEPPTAGRGEKDGDRDGGMMRFARRFSRLLGTKAARAATTEMRNSFREAQAAVALPAEDIFETPGAYLSDLHDCTSPFYFDEAAFTETFDYSSVASNDYYSPHL